MGDFFGKRSKRRQTATMNQMNQMIQEQVDMYTTRQEEAQAQADATRADFEAFEFTNPFAGAQNVYAGARNPYADLTNQFAGMQNLYEGMENRFEDMTVDMRAADFQVQQGQQQRANIMQGLRGAAGTSGVAGLAQAMAGQASIQAQQAAGAMQQQQMQMAGAAQQQQMILEGEAAVQAAEFGQQSTLLGMDYGMLAGANAAQQQALANQMSGMGMKADMYGSQSQNSMFNTLTDAASNVLTYDISDRRLKKNINKIDESPSGLNIYSFEYGNKFKPRSRFVVSSCSL